MTARVVMATGFAAVCIWGTACAQAHPIPRITIALPEGIASDKVVVQYFLYGSFGAFGSDLHPKPNSRSVEVRTSVGTKPAKEIRMFVWAPGCQMATFDIPLPESAHIHESFLCAFLPMVSLEGQLRSPELLKTKGAEVSLIYVAHWACGFFGLADCRVPQIQLGSVKLDADGVFATEIPDFRADPIADDSMGGAELELLLQDSKTLNHIARLEPELEEFRSPGLDLKIEPAYPRNLGFIARRPN